MTNLLAFFAAHGADLLEGLSLIIAGASVLANFTRTDKDNAALRALDRLVQFLAANFFNLKGGRDA